MNAELENQSRSSWRFIKAVIILVSEEKFSRVRDFSWGQNTSNFENLRNIVWICKDFFMQPAGLPKETSAWKLVGYDLKTPRCQNLKSHLTVVFVRCRFHGATPFYKSTSVMMELRPLVYVVSTTASAQFAAYVGARIVGRKLLDCTQFSHYQQCYTYNLYQEIGGKFMQKIPLFSRIKITKCKFPWLLRVHAY